MRRGRRRRFIGSTPEQHCGSSTAFSSPRDGSRLLWYERDESDELTEAVGELIRTAPDAAQIESARIKSGDVLATHPLFEDYDRRKIRNASWLDQDGLKGRAFSASYAPKDDAGRAAWAAGLDALYKKHQIDGLVRLCYETTLHLARRR